MSFFFSAQKKKVTKRVGNVAPARGNRSNKETLNRLGCRGCPLDKAHNETPKMSPEVEEQSDIYFLGNGPSETDDTKGYPFSDKAGKILRSFIRDTVICSYDNVVRDFDADKKQPQWISMECCRSYVIKSIEQAKPKIIVGLGDEALQWVLGTTDMIGLRGRIFAVQIGKHACWFMPTYHPQFIIKNAYEGQDPLRSKLGHCLKFDIARAVQLSAELDPPVIDTPQAVRAGIQAFNGKGVGQLGAVLNLINEARKAPVKAIDLETSHLRPYAAGAAVLTCALSFGSTNFAFAVDHPMAGWRPQEKAAIKTALRELLTDVTKIIAHNAPFEVEWLIFLLSRDAIFHDVWECTMMQAHFLDERRGKRGGNDDQFQPNPYQALDFLVKQNFGIAYKGVFKLDRKNMAKADLDETLLYNGADTKYTLRLYKLQTHRLKYEGLLDSYREAQPRQPTVALMQSIGIDIDQHRNQEFRKRLKLDIAPVRKRIFALPEVQRFIKDNHEYNPESNPQTLRLFKDYLKIDQKLLVGSDGKLTVDKGALQRIKHPIGKDLEEFRNKIKMKSTYVDSFRLGRGKYVHPDGKIHPSFNTTFSETGRTSSDEPNQQNWPSRSDKWIRRQVVAPKGHLLVAFDYGQLEGCTGAMCSKDAKFVEALWNDYDMHMAWAIRAVELFPAYTEGKTDAKTMDTFRKLIKNKMVFPAFFGAAKESIHGYLTVATGVEAPKKIIDKLFEEFWSYFNGVGRWQKDLVRDYYETGYVQSPTGRRRHYPLSRPQAINYPIQSVACDIVCHAMVDLSNRAAETGNWYIHPVMNIHDDLTFVIPDDTSLLTECIEKIYRVMLAPVFPFMNVPMSVSCSIGENWLDMEELGKFWSHKDL